jgi:hypothetical protein
MLFDLMRQIIDKHMAKFAGFCHISDTREKSATLTGTAPS